MDLTIPRLRTGFVWSQIESHYPFCRMGIDYENLTADELARDPFFKNWILKPSPSVNHFWKSFLLLHPTQKQKMQLARDLLTLAYGFSDIQLDQLRKDELLRQLIARIDQGGNLMIRTKIILSVAAVSVLFVIVLASSMISEYDSDYESIHTAGFGERQKIVLPDGSVVDLNANSTLRFGKRWDQGFREVELEGEAYFEVERQLTYAAGFNVQTNGPDVEVVSTHFNFDSGNEKTRIYLEEGKYVAILNDVTEANQDLYRQMKSAN